MLGYAMLCYAMWCCGMVWYGMVWYGMVWYGMVWYGMVWYGMVWYGMVWYGMVWYGMVWYVCMYSCITRAICLGFTRMPSNVVHEGWFVTRKPGATGQSPSTARSPGGFGRLQESETNETKNSSCRPDQSHSLGGPVVLGVCKTDRSSDRRAKPSWTQLVRELQRLSFKILAKRRVGGSCCSFASWRCITSYYF